MAKTRKPELNSKANKGRMSRKSDSLGPCGYSTVMASRKGAAPVISEM